GYFTDVAAAAGLEEPTINVLAWGSALVDVDLDGDLDVFTANGHVIQQCEQIGMNPWKMPNQLFLRDGDVNGVPAFRLSTPDPASPLAVVESSRGVAVGDPDDDGDLDFVVIDMDRAPQVLENRTARPDGGGHWLELDLTGTRSPRGAYGARIEIDAGGRTLTRWKIPNQGLYSSQDPRVHVGLGATDRVDRVRVAWTSGIVSVLTDVPVDRRLALTEPATGDAH
ncbi:MAG: ASPIC/UnbV domain-containing protein, partial [Gemmatimonadetes bacterium]|nr:ASPIC/UnbV domain-containing protein [Gemmatimonadota bacterium]